MYGEFGTVRFVRDVVAARGTVWFWRLPKKLIGRGRTDMGRLIPLAGCPAFSCARLIDLDDRLVKLLSNGFMSGGSFEILRNMMHRYSDIANVTRCSAPTTRAPNHVAWISVPVAAPLDMLDVQRVLSVELRLSSACVRRAVKT